MHFLYFQISADSGYSVSFRLEQLTKLLYSIEDKVKHRGSYSLTVHNLQWHTGRWCQLQMTKGFSISIFRLRVPCLSLLDAKEVTGNRSYRLLRLRCFSDLVIVSRCAKMKLCKMSGGLWFVWSVSSFTRRPSKNLWVFPWRCSWKWMLKVGSSS